MNGEIGADPAVIGVLSWSSLHFFHVQHRAACHCQVGDGDGVYEQSANDDPFCPNRRQTSRQKMTVHGRIRDSLDPRSTEAPIGANIAQSFLVSNLPDTSTRFNLSEVLIQTLDSLNA